MLTALRKVFARFRAEGHEDIHTPKGVTAQFSLQYRDLTVGTLSLEDGIWRFSYSPAFHQQNVLQPLVAFPDASRIYESESLWPFFMARIPGISQPEVKKLIQAEGLDPHSDVALLRRFGQSSISNPFVLQQTG